MLMDALLVDCICRVVCCHSLLALLAFHQLEDYLEELTCTEAPQWVQSTQTVLSTASTYKHVIFLLQAAETGLIIIDTQVI